MPRKPLPAHLRRPVGRPPVYPWDLWLDGRPHTLIEGTDYKCDTASMRSQVYAAARAAGKKVSVKKVFDTGLKVQTGQQVAGAQRKYDWDRLFDGTVHQLRVGVDIPTNVRNFRTYGQAVAADRGHGFSVKRLGEFVFVQAIGLPAAKPPTDPFGVL